ncbi:MAG: response regulator transcription factor [Candidatus Rokubacteria bacterium]|nr:response regulator transcription factor [Candidatus Rokubacteria bacterium]
MSETTTIVLADDHQVVRQGLRALLEREPDFSVVAEAADGATALEAVRERDPDVLVLDLVMPGVGGLDVLRQLGAERLRTRTVVLSMHSSEAYVVEALTHGASGYVLKDATASDLAHAVREAVAGRRYLSPPLSERVIDAYTRRAHEASMAPHQVLTPRELQVLRLAALGRSLAEIASDLAISRRTAETHRGHFMRKLGLRSQTEVVRFALRNGLLPPDPATPSVRQTP